jgi:hypothetical protein
MENQELMSSWASLQARVEKLIAVQAESDRQNKHARSLKHRDQLRWAPIQGIICAALLLLVVGNLFGDHWASILAAPASALPAVLTFGFAVWTIRSSVLQLILSSKLDFNDPVLVTQSRLAELRKRRVEAAQGSAMFWLVGWVLVPVLLLQMLAGPGVLVKLASPWLVGNIVFGVVAGCGLLWAVARSKFGPKIQATLAGKEIVEAQEFLRQIEEFQIP